MSLNIVPVIIRSATGTIAQGSRKPLGVSNLDFSFGPFRRSRDTCHWFHGFMASLPICSSKAGGGITCEALPFSSSSSPSVNTRKDDHPVLFFRVSRSYSGIKGGENDPKANSHRHGTVAGTAKGSYLPLPSVLAGSGMCTAHSRSTARSRSTAMLTSTSTRHKSSQHLFRWSWQSPFYHPCS